MSYILDALKKSQQERQQQQGPSIQTIHKPHVLHARPAGNPWPWIVLCVLILVLAGGGFWYLQQSAPVPAVPLAMDKPAPANPAPVSDDAAERQAVASELMPAQPTTAAASKPPLVEFYQLPDPVKQQIPALTFSFHVYSANPERRTIIINNQRLREGAVVSEGLQLEEITGQGVILNWQNRHRFAISVVENW